MTEEELQARADHCFGDMVRAFKVWTACFDTPLEMVQKVGNEANFGANRGKSPSGKMLGAIVHCISCGSAHVAKDTNVKHQCTQEATRYPVYGKTNVHPFVIRESLSNITQLLEHDVLGELFELADTADGRSEVVVFVKDKKGVTRVRSGMVSFDVREILMTKPSATFLPRWREQLTAHPDISLGQVFALANSSDAFLVTLAGARFFELWPSAIDDNLNAEESEILNETAENLDFKIKSLLDGFKASQPLFFPAGCAAPEGSCGAMRLSFAPRGQLQHRCEAAREALSLKQPPKKDFRRMTDRPLAAARSLLDFPRLWRRRIWMARNRGSDNEHDVAVELWGLGRFS